MSTLHVLSTRRPAPDQAARLIADLAAAHEAGIDLGSRVPHIQAAGANLQKMAEELEHVLADLEQTMLGHGVHDAEAVRVLTRLAREAGKLAEGAKFFPAHE